MKHPSILKFLTGREEKVNLLRPFHPRDKQLLVELLRCPEEVTIPLEELCYIMVLDKSGWQLPASLPVTGSLLRSKLKGSCSSAVWRRLLDIKYSWAMKARIFAFHHVPGRVFNATIQFCAKLGTGT